MHTNRSVIPQKLLVQIVILLVTFLAVGIAIVWFLRHHRQQQTAHNRQATQLAELGLQKALERFHEDPQWREGVDTTHEDDGWYTVTLDQHVRDSVTLIRIESTGHAGNISQKRRWTLRRSVHDNDTVWVRYLDEE